MLFAFISSYAAFLTVKEGEPMPYISMSSFEEELQNAQQFFSWVLTLFGKVWELLTTNRKFMFVATLLIISAVAALFIRLRHIRG